MPLYKFNDLIQSLYIRGRRVKAIYKEGQDILYGIKNKKVFIVRLVRNLVAGTYQVEGYVLDPTSSTARVGFVFRRGKTDALDYVSTQTTRLRQGLSFEIVTDQQLVPGNWVYQAWYQESERVGRLYSDPRSLVIEDLGIVFNFIRYENLTNSSVDVIFQLYGGQLPYSNDTMAVNIQGDSGNRDLIRNFSNLVLFPRDLLGFFRVSFTSLMGSTTYDWAAQITDQTGVDGFRLIFGMFTTLADPILPIFDPDMLSLGPYTYEESLNETFSFSLTNASHTTVEAVSNVNWITNLRITDGVCTFNLSRNDSLVTSPNHRLGTITLTSTLPSGSDTLVATVTQCNRIPVIDSFSISLAANQLTVNVNYTLDDKGAEVIEHGYYYYHGSQPIVASAVISNMSSVHRRTLTPTGITGDIDSTFQGIRGQVVTVVVYAVSGGLLPQDVNDDVTVYSDRAFLTVPDNPLVLEIDLPSSGHPVSSDAGVLSTITIEVSGGEHPRLSDVILNQTLIPLTTKVNGWVNSVTIMDENLLSDATSLQAATSGFIEIDYLANPSFVDSRSFTLSGTLREPPLIASTDSVVFVQSERTPTITLTLPRTHPISDGATGTDVGISVRGGFLSDVTLQELVPGTSTEGDLTSTVVAWIRSGVILDSQGRSTTTALASATQGIVRLTLLTNTGASSRSAVLKAYLFEGLASEIDTTLTITQSAPDDDPIRITISSIPLQDRDVGNLDFTFFITNATAPNIEVVGNWIDSSIDEDEDDRRQRGTSTFLTGFRYNGDIDVLDNNTFSTITRTITVFAWFGSRANPTRQGTSSRTFRQRGRRRVCPEVQITSSSTGNIIQNGGGFSVFVQFFNRLSSDTFTVTGPNWVTIPDTFPLSTQTLTATANTDEDSRSGTITVTITRSGCPVDSSDWDIEQAGTGPPDPDIEVDVAPIDDAAWNEGSGSTTYEITNGDSSHITALRGTTGISNIDYEEDEDDDTIGTITWDLSNNRSELDRVLRVTMEVERTGRGDDSDTESFTQEGQGDVTIEFDSIDSIDHDDTTFSFSFTIDNFSGKSITLDLSSPDDRVTMISYSESSTSGVYNGTFTVPENDTRSNISYVLNGSIVNNNEETDTDRDSVTAVQRRDPNPPIEPSPCPEISMTPTSVSFNHTGGSRTISVSLTNYVSTDAVNIVAHDWITFPSTLSAGTSSVTLTVGSTTAARSGNVSVSVSRTGCLVSIQTVDVTQSAPPACPTVTLTATLTGNVPSNGGNIPFSFTRSNFRGSETITTSSSSFVSVPTTFVNSQGTIVPFGVAMVSAYTGTTPRSGFFSISVSRSGCPTQTSRFDFTQTAVLAVGEISWISGRDTFFLTPRPSGIVNETFEDAFESTAPNGTTYSVTILTGRTTQLVFSAVSGEFTVTGSFEDGDPTSITFRITATWGTSSSSSIDGELLITVDDAFP